MAETTLASGQGTVAATLLPTGTYQLFAQYAGDATFAPSKSDGLPVTITPAIVSGAVLTASRTTVQAGQKVTFALLVPGVPNGVGPTGMVTFTNTTNGVVLGTATITSNPQTNTTPTSTASITVSSNQLQAGANTIAASYSGDTNYATTNAVAPTVTLIGAFTTSIDPSSLTLTPNAAGSATVTVTPNGSTTLNPSSLTFSCPANLPAGLSCSFGAPAAGSGGAVTSILTLQTALPLFKKHSLAATARTSRGGWLGAGAIASVAGLIMLGLPGRRMRMLLALTLTAFSSLSFMIGCSGGGSSGGKTQSSLIATTTALSVFSNDIYTQCSGRTYCKREAEFRRGHTHWEHRVLSGKYISGYSQSCIGFCQSHGQLTARRGTGNHRGLQRRFNLCGFKFPGQ